MAATAAITNQGQTYFMRLGLSLFMAFLSSIEADLGRFGPRIKSSRRTPPRRLPEGRRLSDAAMGTLKATNGEWLFPSETSETGHIVDPAAWRGRGQDHSSVHAAWAEGDIYKCGSCGWGQRPSRSASCQPLGPFLGCAWRLHPARPGGVETKSTEDHGLSSSAWPSHLARAPRAPIERRCCGDFQLAAGLGLRFRRKALFGPRVCLRPISRSVTHAMTQSQAVGGVLEPQGFAPPLLWPLSRT